MKTKKAPSKRVFNTTLRAFIRPIGFPNEVYGVLIEFVVIQAPYTLDAYKLSKARTLQSSPRQEPRYIGVEAGGAGLKIACQPADFHIFCYLKCKSQLGVRSLPD